MHEEKPCLPNGKTRRYPISHGYNATAVDSTFESQSYQWQAALNLAGNSNGKYTLASL